MRSFAAVCALVVLGGCWTRHDVVGRTDGILNVKEVAEEAYVYAFPMIAAYKALYQFNVDTTSSQYLGPFNTIHNEARVFTPKDTAIVTPNSDTPYSMVQLDLRAEPMVLCVPAVETRRYYSVQLTDMYAFNYGYIGSRATGNAAGCFLVVGPDWQGMVPAGIRQTFRSETQFGLVIYRTQLFDAADLPNVKKVQAGYRVQPLSAYTEQPAPPAAPAVAWPPFTEAAFKTDFLAYLDFLLQFCPEVPAERAVRARFTNIGVGPGGNFSWKELSAAHKVAVGLGVKDAYARIVKQRDEIGTDVNGWAVGSAFGDRAFYGGDFLLRAAAALAGIYGNDAGEAMSPLTRHDEQGVPLDGSEHDYTLTFAAGQFPPVNAFWSVTMYDGTTQLLIDNPIDRYLVNSPMLPGLRKNADGSLTLYVQHAAPTGDKRANWLPAPDGPISLVMRLYWPTDAPPSILPPGQGTWGPPPVLRAG